MPDIIHSTNGSNLGDVLEMVLDKGIVIAGDIRIKLVEVELLTINIRLLIASVDRAREMGIDWWSHSSFLSSRARPTAELPPVQAEIDDLRSRMEQLERASQHGGLP